MCFETTILHTAIHAIRQLFRASFLIEKTAVFDRFPELPVPVTSDAL
jgi:hypothetical protein